jgi:hypothetical protein
MMNLDNKVKMRVIPLVTKRTRHARRGQKALIKPTLLWCIEYESGGLFSYGYYRKLDAMKVMRAMEMSGTDTVRYRDFNVVSHVDHTMHVWPISEVR